MRASMEQINISARPNTVTHEWKKISPNKMETVGSFLKCFGKIDFLKVIISAYKAIETGKNKIQTLQT